MHNFHSQSNKFPKVLSEVYGINRWVVHHSKKYCDLIMEI